MKTNQYTLIVSRCFLFAVLLCLCGSAYTQSPAPDILWEKSFGITPCSYQFGEGFYDIQSTSDGHFILAGNYCSQETGADILLVKMDETKGDFLWTRTYGGASDDQGFSAQETSDGGYIVAGATQSESAGSWDVFLLKTNADGDSLWMKTYGGVGGDGSLVVQQTPDGGYFLAASTESYGAGYADIWLLKTDANGDTLWTKTYGGTGNDAIWPENGGWTIVKGRFTPADGGYVVASYTNSFGDNDYDMWLLKTDANGDTLWTKRYGGTEDELGLWMDVQVAADGGYIMAATTHSFGDGTPSNSNVYLVKTDAAGEIVWAKDYGGGGDYEVWSVQQTYDGGYIISAHTTAFGRGMDIWLLKIDSDGEILWEKTVGESDNEVGRSIVQSRSGEYIVVGSTTATSDGGWDCYVVKLAVDPPINGWQSKAPMPTHRWNLCSSVVDEKIYTFGGSDDEGALSAVEVYDPAINSWTAKQDLPIPNYSFCASTVNDKIYLMGSKAWHEAPTPIVYQYDPASDSYLKKQSMNTARSSFAASVVNSKIYVFGGSLYYTSGFLAGVEEYDPATNTWTIKTDMPNGARTGHAAAVVNDKIYIIGGYNPESDELVLATVEEYDPATDTWTTKSPMPTPRCWLTASVVDNKIYAIGGILNDQPVSIVEEFDPSTDTWTTKSPMQTARFGLCSQSIDRIIYTFGGSIVTSSPWGPGLSAVEAYDPSLDTFVEIKETDTIKPLTFTLLQNYPNPFNPTTTIEYDVPKVGHVTLSIYDVLGRHVQTLIDKNHQAGSFQTSWDGTDERGLPVAGGLYFCRMQTGEFSSVMKMVLVR